MILNLLSDDGFLSVAISTLIQEIGNFKFIVTPTTKIPFGVEESNKKIVYLVDGRVLRVNMNLWLFNDKNHHTVFLTFTPEQKSCWETVGPVFDMSGSVKMVRDTIKNILVLTLSEVDVQDINDSSLTKRENEIYSLLRKGWSVCKVAEYFHCSPKTIYAHRRKIANKKGVKRFYNLYKEIYSHFG